MKKFLEIIKKIILFASLLIICTYFVLNTNIEEDIPFIVSLPMVILIVYIWNKINNKFFK